MPSSNNCCSNPPRVCVLRPVKTVKDVAVFMDGHAPGARQLGADPKAVLKRLKAHGRLAFVVENGVGIEIGSCSLTETEPAIAVVGVTLLPRFRCMGYGKVILREVEKVATAEGFIALRADIIDGNLAATELFGSAGYQRYSLFEKALG